jgi:hypothetical protein
MLENTRQPYRPAVKATYLEKSQLGIFPLFDSLAVTTPVFSNYGRPEGVCHLLSSCILPSQIRVIPRYLNLVTSSRGVPLYVKVGTAGISFFV